jgi:hypothetical protein
MADGEVQLIVTALRAYEAEHPRAKVDVYRQNEVSVRVRVIDPDFKGKTLGERERQIWRIINQLPSEVASEVTMLVLMTPGEARKSQANYEFEHPTPCPPELRNLIDKKVRRNGSPNADR